MLMFKSGYDPRTERHDATETMDMMEMGDVSTKKGSSDVQTWKAVFDKYDQDNDGAIPLREVGDIMLRTNIRHEVPFDVLNQMLRRADADHNGMLDFREFYSLVKSPEISSRNRKALKMFASYSRKMIVPRSKRVQDAVDGRYIDEYNCYPPPITIFVLSIVEIAVYIYYSTTLKEVSPTGPVPFTSVLIYNPHKRYEAWRFISYMLIHAGYYHILFNVVIQLALGIPLEMVHKFWRIWLVYMAGVVGGSLGTSISDPGVYLAGASGGVYALITAHLATIIMNFKEMDLAIFQLLGFIGLMTLDVSIAVYSRYITKMTSNTGYAAHLAGAIAGLLMGIVVLRNLEIRRWENVVWWISLVLFIVMMLTMIIWNAAFPSYFAVAT